MFLSGRARWSFRPTCLRRSRLEVTRTLYENGRIGIAIGDLVLQYILIRIQLETGPFIHIGANHLISVTQEGHVFLFLVFPTDPFNFVTGKHHLTHFDTGICEESGDFLGISNNLGVLPVILFRQLVPESVLVEFG